MMRHSSCLAAMLLLGAAPVTAQSPNTGDETIAPSQLLQNVGFSGSEAVRYDAAADVYLVSNIGPEEGKGFVSRVSPEGEVSELKWIEGGVDGVTLIRPLGLYVQGSHVYVADPQAIRVFDRETGDAVRSIDIPDAVRLNDLTVLADGTIYASDSGSDDSAGALYVVRNGQVSTFVARDDAVERPNGVAVLEDGTVVHGGRGVNLVFRDPQGNILRERTLPTGQFDGIIPLGGGNLLVASQAGNNVYRVPSDGKPEIVADGITVPAAIGWDSERNVLLVPQIRAATLGFYPLD